MFLLTLTTQPRALLIGKKHTANCNWIKSVCCTCLDCTKENSMRSEDIKTNMQLLSCKLFIMSAYMLNIFFLHLLHLPIAPRLQRAIVLAFFVPLKLCHSNLFVGAAPTHHGASVEKRRRQTRPLASLFLLIEPSDTTIPRDKYFEERQITSWRCRRGLVIQTERHGFHL